MNALRPKQWFSCCFLLEKKNNKKNSKMENLSYFNLNSTEDCGERGSHFFCHIYIWSVFLEQFCPTWDKENWELLCNWLQIID